MTKVVMAAGFSLSEEVKSRTDYFTIETFSTAMFEHSAPELLAEEEILVRRMLPRAETDGAPIGPLKRRIRVTGLPSFEEARRIVRLMNATAHLEA